MRKFLAVSVGIMVLSVGGVGLRSQEANAAQVDGVTQAWDKNLPSASRFTVLAAFGGAAVRDNNTGLVWEQAPDTTLRVWRVHDDFSGAATIYCVNKPVGGTRGWRLPSVAELTSLIDPTLPAPFVPAPAFTFSTGSNPGVLQSSYFSATMNSYEPTHVWSVDFSSGSVSIAPNASDHPQYVWCVRGPMNADAY